MRRELFKKILVYKCAKQPLFTVSTLNASKGCKECTLTEAIGNMTNKPHNHFD